MWSNESDSDARSPVVAVVLTAGQARQPVSGRPIAGVMGHEGAAWLDRPEREAEEAETGLNSLSEGSLGHSKRDWSEILKRGAFKTETKEKICSCSASVVPLEKVIDMHLRVADQLVRLPSIPRKRQAINVFPP